MVKLIAAGALLGAGLLARSQYERNHFSVERTTIHSEKIKEKRTCLFLTDLHDKEFGPDNRLLLEAAAAGRPDFILIGGDMMVSKGTGDLAVTFRLVEALARLAPVYYGIGNHEMRLKWEYQIYGRQYFRLVEKLARLGIPLLADAHLDIGSDLTVNGVDLHPSFYRKLFLEKKASMADYYLNRKLGKPDKERFQILLCHSPLYFNECANWGADLTLSGHFHGGTIRIPGLGGVMTPQYQFFIPWCAGEFLADGKRMIVGRGLGTHSINIRLNDKPQLLFIELMPKQDDAREDRIPADRG